MLVDFRVKNYRSIKDDQTLSMVATSGNEFEKSHTFLLPNTKNISLVKTAAIYGANAAGKSNLLKALKTMRRIILESNTRGDKLDLQSFLLHTDSIDKPSEFEITFVFEEIRYQYGFTATNELIMEEWLIAYPKGRPQNWFARAYDDIKKEYQWQFGDKLIGQKQIWKESTRSNALFLSTAVNLNSEQLKPIFDWFANKLKITGIQGWSPTYTMQRCAEDDFKEKIMQFLKTADIDIEDVEVELEEFDINKLPKDMPSNIKMELEKKMNGLEIPKETKFLHLNNLDEKIALDFDDESDGTRKLFSFIGPWLDSLENGNVLVIDELHDNFHPLMVKFLIDMFHNNDMNKSNAQLIFTTHETSVLNQNIFRRDQIWFCEKQNRATTLYPLTDFSPRKGVEDLEKGYLSGRYGALPFFQDISMAMGK
ncbi:AAA family ATPase [Aliarcobacter butzleri]|uniref:AAA family ATPase n=1 Tax=Aliarcobacter butzleri TaxID=28197 RepID=UPI001EDA69AE|nr:ATP-binding protein [Aliarcobacter butzleri]MCG3676220.1 ATP-binding protein [Aliarcobacter butzleri]